MKTLRIVVVAMVCVGPLMPQPAAAQTDIVGLKLGMTLEQAQAALRAHSRSVRFRPVNEVLPGAGTPFVSLLWAGVFGDTQAGTGDEVFKLEFSNPPASRLMVVWRRQTFPQGHELGLENTLAAFREKYGEPRFNRTWAMGVQWTWTATQQRVDQSICSVQANVALAISPQEVIRPVLTEEKRTYLAAPQCGTAVDVTVENTQRLVTNIATMLVDYPAAAKAREEVEAMSRQPDTRSIEAESRGKPKL